MKRLLILTMSLVACGGGDDGFDAPTCAEGEVVVEGTIDGESFETARSGYDGYIFVNKIGDDLGQLDVTYADGDTLSLRFPELVADGASVEARGSVGFLSDGLDVGNCEDDGFPGTLRMDDEGGGGTFLLTSLRQGGDCGGDAVDGELTGCFRSEPF